MEWWYSLFSSEKSTMLAHLPIAFHKIARYLLWKTSLTIRSPCQGWSGMMQAVQTGSRPGQSSVLFMPIIDMDPGDMSCIYSTLLFVCNHASRYSATPIITFDQPLWSKAMSTMESESEISVLNLIVLRLGGFHLLLSLLGAIRNIMAGSRLRRILELVYAENTVTHMMSGKAYMPGPSVDTL